MNTAVAPWDKPQEKLRVLDACVAKLADMIFIMEAAPLEEPGPRIVLINEAFEACFGYEKSEVLGRSPRILEGKKTDRRVVGEIYRALRNHQPIQRQLFQYDKRGRAHWVEMRVVPIFDRNGECSYFSTTLRPITESREQEEALRLSGERFSQAFEYGPIGMALVAPDGHWLTANRAFCELIGYAADELRHKTFQRITHPEDLPEELELARQTLMGESHFYQMEKRIFHKRGHTLWIHLTVSLVRDANGYPLYFIQQVQNITESKHANEKIAEQAALLDKTNDAITLCDMDGRVLFWNKGAEAIYGWTAAEAEGRQMKELSFKSNAAQYDEACLATLQQGKWVSEIHVAHKDGRELVIQSHWSLIKDQAEKAKAFLGISYDITDRKQIEAQLMRAQRMESIGTLAGGIAHDLNNILTPILMSIEMLKQTTTHPQAQSILETIEITSRRGADIVRQVLSFARGMKGDRIEVQPRHLLKDIQALIKETLPKNIQLKYSFPAESWTILGDPTQLHQILLNLCVNARDAMPTGGCLTISAENAVIDGQYASMHVEARPGVYVVIRVSDTGTGIPPSVIDKIFEPFFTTKEIGKGTGLGLSTVIALVKSHDGFVTVSSEVGKGTTFKVYLPAIEVSSKSASEEEERVSLPRGNDETILIVDDEASILTITSQSLEAFGYRTLCANDGVEALALYAQHRDRIAAVLTDMAMPIMDGPATIRVLLKMNPRIRIIAASGLKTNETISQELDGKIKYFINKPYSAGTLLKTLRKVLSEV
jgi:PAS domain S-box-containing protein